MNFARLSLVLGILLALGLSIAGVLRATAAPDLEPDVDIGKPDPAAPEPQQVTLKVRKDNGPYGESAYSFRLATHDVAVHKNYVDVLLNGCGQLHVRPVTGVESRILDLGKSALADAPDAPPDGDKAAGWKTESLRPVAGHVYLLDIKESDQTMTVKFAVDAVTADGVKLTWLTVKPLAGPAPHPNRGRAGTMGQCGGDHESR